MPARDDATTLELRGLDDAFRRVESWLGEQGFFRSGGDELAADLYLGYGLPQSIRRESTPPPPEPCPALPRAARGFRSRRRASEQHAAGAADLVALSHEAGPAPRGARVAPAAPGRAASSGRR